MFTDLRGSEHAVVGRYDYDEPVIGSTIRVYYDPSDRTKVVTENDTGTGRLAFAVVFGMFLTLFAIAIGWPAREAFAWPLEKRTSTEF